jgi:hypothetical protein
MKQSITSEFLLNRCSSKTSYYEDTLVTDKKRSSSRHTTCLSNNKKWRQINELHFAAPLWSLFPASTSLRRRVLSRKGDKRMLEFLTLQIEHASSPLLGKKRRTESRVLKTFHSN